MSHSQQRIAITGGIGSGKSYVCRLLQERGISIYDCDAAAKRLMRSSDLLRQQLTDLIGSLCDLTSGSGDKGTPVVLVQGYFDNYTN